VNPADSRPRQAPNTAGSVAPQANTAAVGSMPKKEPEPPTRFVPGFVTVARPLRRSPTDQPVHWALAVAYLRATKLTGTSTTKLRARARRQSVLPPPFRSPDHHDGDDAGEIKCWNSHHPNSDGRTVCDELLASQNEAAGYLCDEEAEEHEKHATIDISRDETQEHWNRARYASWHHRILDILMGVKMLRVAQLDLTYLRTALFNVSTLPSKARVSSFDISGQSTSHTPALPTTLGSDSATP